MKASETRHKEGEKGMASKKTVTQEERLLDWLMQGHKVTVASCLRDLGIGCPTKIISNLRKTETIRGELKTGKNRYGEKVCFMEYSYVGENDDVDE